MGKAYLAAFFKTKQEADKFAEEIRKIFESKGFVTRLDWRILLGLKNDESRRLDHEIYIGI